MLDFLRMIILEITKKIKKVVLEELEANEIGGPTMDQNDEIIVDQPVVRSETIQIEEHPILLRYSDRVVG